MVRARGLVGSTRSPGDAPIERETALRPAFYALGSGGVRDYVTLLHPPYTAWHLSYVVIGAALAPSFSPRRCLVTLAAFFLAVGIAAHAMDELHDRPLATEISTLKLAILSCVGMAGAVALGVWGAVTVSGWLLVFIAVGTYLAVAYSLELFAGRFHSDWWFAVAWGGFPLMTAYFAQAGRITAVSVIAAGSAVALSRAQRVLSTNVRDLRRATKRVVGYRERQDGTRTPITRTNLVAVDETALRMLAMATVLLAVALVLFRLA
jgi:hypothetical protein